MEPPSELKHLKRFVREAKKTEKLSPVISYYCRLYAIQEAMKLDDGKKTSQTKQWISSEISSLEKMPKQDISKEKAQETVLSMANNVFEHADEVDRSGKADKQTAAAFNSAGVFYTILKQFGDLSDEAKQRIKYCLFKTTDILKALKEGRKPEPGPPGGIDAENDALDAELKKMSGDFHEDSSSYHNPTDDHDVSQEPASKGNKQHKNTDEDDGKLPSSNNNMPNPSYGFNNNQQPMNNTMPFNINNNNNVPFNQPYQNPMPAHQPPASYKPTSQMSYADHGNVKQLKLPQYIAKVEACSEAEQLFKEVITSLRFEDAESAISKAQKAIKILSSHR